MNEERKTLISRLTKIHPYPASWFETKTTAELIAMYNSKKRNRPDKNAMAKTPVPIINEADHRRRNSETGLWEVKTEGHGWEPEES